MRCLLKESATFREMPKGSPPGNAGSSAPGRYSRALSFNERLFLALDEISPPYCNQLVFDGTGILDYPRWCEAVRIASSANPGSRVALKGHLGFSRWVDTGVTPQVREVDGSRWDGSGPADAPFLQDRLPYRKGPTCEVLLAKGPVPRVVFRSHHGVMDGRGTLIWAEDVFRALRGERALGAFSTVNDCGLAHRFQALKHKPFPPDHLAPTGKANGQGPGFIWKRITLRGTFPHVLAHCVRLAALEAWSRGKGVVRFGIPVDMRPRLSDARSTASLAFALYVHITPEKTTVQIARDISSQVSQGREGMTFPGDRFLRHVPLRFISWKARKNMEKMKGCSLYSLSGMVSNLGRIDLNLYQGGGFLSHAFWSVPPFAEYHPFFLVLAGHGETIELTLGMPRVLGDNGRLDEVLDHISQGLYKNKENIHA